MDAAVLVPLYGWPRRPGLIFTERHGQLRRHAGEISFPGGLRDHDGEELTACALREAQEEIGLDSSLVEVLCELPTVSTLLTGYRVHPFLGLVPEQLDLTPNPLEVERILRFPIEELRASFVSRRLVRQGLPFRTDAYEIEGHLIWGATARILRRLLVTLGEGLPGTAAPDTS